MMKRPVLLYWIWGLWMVLLTGVYQVAAAPAATVGTENPTSVSVATPFARTETPLPEPVTVTAVATSSPTVTATP